MNSFKLTLHDAVHHQEIEQVVSFVGEDTSGSFGILPGHGRMMTPLIIGLARFRVLNQPWTYLALPGGILYFHDNTLTISTRHYLLDENYMRISQALQAQLLVEEEKLQSTKHSLHRMEEQILKRLWEMGRLETG